MKKLNLLLLLMLTFGALFAQDKSTLIIGKLVKVVPPMKDLKPVDESKLIRAYDEKGNRIWPEGVTPQPKPVIAGEPVPEGYTDPMIQKMDQAANGNITPELASGITTGIEGQATGIRVFDPTICVGSNHVIQLVNGTNGATMQAWTKDGTTVIAPISLQALSGLPPGGDPIALYDQLADRYILTQFITGNGTTEPSGMSIIVSRTGDPTQGWFSYRWTIPEFFLLDYPKWAVGPTGLFLHTNNFVLPNATNLTSSFFAAFNKTDMYSGSSTFRSLRINQSGGPNKSTCPAQVQGNGAVAGGQFFVSLVSVGRSSGISVIECNADWNSNTLTQRTVQSIATSYLSNVCSASEDVCVQQLNSSVRVEVLSGRIMNQPIIRVLPNGQTGMVFCHSINTSNGRSGIRWTELRRAGTGWSLFQQSTWHPNGDHHFMGSMAYDANGNIGLGYNTGGPGRYLGISYTARKACDPLNQMTLPETSLREGTAATDNTRWGDYSHMVADPDGQSVWMTAMYGRAGAAGGRGSYISRIILPSCGETCLPPSSLSANNITGSDVQLTWAAAPSAVSYTVEFKPAASANWVAAGATTATIFSLSGLSAATTYDWRVMSNCSFGSSIFSAAQFTTAAGGGTCATPTGLTSLPDCLIGEVSWNPVPGAISYRVEFKRNTSTVWTTGATATTDLFYTINATGGVYDWRVQANCGGAMSEFANSAITILGGTQCLQRIVSADVKNSAQKIKVSPQPADNELAVSLSAGQRSTVTAEFINQQGSVVQRNTAAVNKGTNTIRLNVSKLSAGMYILRLKLREKTEITKVVIE